MSAFYLVSFNDDVQMINVDWSSYEEEQEQNGEVEYGQTVAEERYYNLTKLYQRNTKIEDVPH